MEVEVGKTGSGGEMFAGERALVLYFIARATAGRAAQVLSHSWREGAALCCIQLCGSLAVHRRPRWPS